MFHVANAPTLYCSRNIHCTKSENGALSLESLTHDRCQYRKPRRKDCQSEASKKSRFLLVATTASDSVIQRTKGYCMVSLNMSHHCCLYARDATKQIQGWKYLLVGMTLCCLISLPYCNPSNDLSGAFLGLEVYLSGLKSHSDFKRTLTSSSRYLGG